MYKIIEATHIQQSHTENLFWIHNGQHRPTKNTKTKHKEEAFSSLTSDFANLNAHDSPNKCLI